MPGVSRIGPRRPRRIYLAEHREARGLTQEQLGAKLGVAGMTVSRWERGTAKLSSDVMAAIAEVLAIEPGDLYRHPDSPSADVLLRGQPKDVVDQAMKILRAMRKE